MGGRRIRCVFLCGFDPVGEAGLMVGSGSRYGALRRLETSGIT